MALDILWQGTEHESFSDYNAPSFGGFSRDAAQSNAAFRLSLSGSQFVEGDAGADQTAICATHYHGNDGTSLAAGAAEYLKFLDSSKVGWLRVRMPTTVGTLVAEVWNGATWNSVGSGSIAMSGIQNKHANCLVTGIGTSGGAIRMQFDGVTVFDLTGLDFTGFAGIRYVRWGCLGTDSGRSDLSQFQLGTETMVGRNSKTVAANSNGTDATDGSGTYTDVNETGLNDGTFIELTAVGHKRSVKAAARTLAKPTCKGVTVNGRLMVVDGTGPQQVKPYLLIGGVRYYGTTFALTTGFKSYSYTWDQNPATAAPWTMSDVNSANLEWGWEAVA